MTKDRVRQLSAEYVAKWMNGQVRDAAQLRGYVEFAILAALDESWGEAPDDAMLDEGFEAMDWDEYGTNADANNRRIAGSVFERMAAVRRAALRPSKPER